MDEDKKNMMRSVFCFDSMLTPKLITFMYWLLLAGVVISAILISIGGNTAGGVLALLFGVVGVRVWCELMIVLFKINENIQKIADRP